MGISDRLSCHPCKEQEDSLFLGLNFSFFPESKNLVFMKMAYNQEPCTIEVRYIHYKNGSHTFVLKSKQKIRYL